MTSFDCVYKGLESYLKTKSWSFWYSLILRWMAYCQSVSEKRLVEYLHESNKVYQGEITLGFQLGAEDAHGEIVSSSPIEVYSLFKRLMKRCKVHWRDYSGSTDVFCGLK